jgi:hypothetical protein
MGPLTATGQMEIVNQSTPPGMAKGKLGKRYVSDDRSRR